ncbi:MAG: amino acid adenylation domain-containing protein [Acidobacteriota bacterium]
MANAFDGLPGSDLNRPAGQNSDGSGGGAFTPPWPTLVHLLRQRSKGSLASKAAYTFLHDQPGDGGEERIAGRLTFGELDRRAREIAAALQQGDLRGQRALLLYSPGIDFVAAFFGCLYAGVIAVPAFPPTSVRSLPRLLAVAEDAQAGVALTTAELAARFQGLAGAAPGMDRIHWIATDTLPDGAADAWRDPRVTGEDLAFLQYTSGSTSAPKGVMVSHANLLHNEELIRRAFGQSEESVIVGWLPLYHDMGLIGNVLQPLYVGASCVLMSPFAFLKAPIRWLRAISRFRATTSGGPNFAYDLSVHKVPPALRQGLDLSSWRVAFNGAEPVRAGTLERFAAAFEPHGFDRRAFQPCYGLAEGTLFVTGEPIAEEPRVRPFDTAALEEGRAAGDQDGRPLVSSGSLAAGVEAGQRLLVVDPESGQERPAGAVGELWLTGPSVTGGYWRREDATREVFGARLADGDVTRFLRTGDLGFVEDGRLFVTGRLKDLIILRGRNHYPQDIELTAETSHRALRPGCSSAFGVTVDDEERLAIALEVRPEVAEKGDRETLAGIVETVRRAIVAGHQVDPHRVVLLAPRSVPKTSSGKVQRRLCRARLLADELPVVYMSGGGDEAPDDPENPSGGGGSEPPADPAQLRMLEGVLLQQAAKLLKVEPESLDREQPLPLDSLAAMEVQEAVEAAFGVSPPLEELFDTPTVASLAAWILEAQKAPPEKPPSAGPAPSTAEGAPVSAAPREIPLSIGQRALWFLERVTPDGDSNHIAFGGRVVSGLDFETFAEPWRRVVKRHPLLSARVVEEGGEARLSIDPEMAVDLTRDTSGDPLDEVLRREVRTPFDLAEGPLARCRWIERAGALEDDRPVLLFVFHHLVADLGSMAVIASELATLLEDSAAELPAPDGAYGEFVARESDRLLGAEGLAGQDLAPEGERLAGFWAAELADVPAQIELPADRPRPPVQNFTAGYTRFFVAADTVAALGRAARAQKATPFVALLAAFQAFLGRLTGQRDFCIGAPSSGRTAAEASLVGYFVNPLVWRADLSPVADEAREPTFGELIARARGRVRAGLDHAGMPFPMLVERVRTERDPSRSPLFQVWLSLAQGSPSMDRGLGAFFLGADGAALDIGPLTLDAVPLEPLAAPFDLSLSLAPLADEAGGRGLTGLFAFARELFDRTTVERWAAAFGRFLEAVVAEPNRPAAEVSLLSPPERQQVLREWNEQQPAAATPSGILEPFRRQVAARPAEIAVSQGDDTLTYAELDAESDRWARHFLSLGARPEELIGVALERRPHLLVALLAALKAGVAYVPIDPTYPADRLRMMIEDSALRWVVSQGDLVDHLPLGDAQPLLIDGPQPANGGEPLPALPSAERAAYVIFTSGSTGRPKGVVVSHGALINFLLAMGEAPGLGADDRWLAVTSLSFDISALELYLPLVVGGRVEIAPRDDVIDGRRLAERLAACRATVMQATPATWRMLIEAGWTGSSSLKILCGGEALPQDLAKDLLARAASLWNLYGPTETTIWSARYRCRTADDGPPPIGRPIRDTRLVLLDRHRRPVPVGVAGELLIGGGGLARGYLGRPALTAERFVPDPLAGAAGSGNRLYRTGDLARWLPDGTVEFLGRLDHQVKVRGFRIELGEIETVLSAVPGVAQAVCAARGDGGAARLIAWATADAGAGVALPDEADLRAAARARLPEYMVPARVVLLDALPLTPNGKIDRNALPSPEREGGGEGFVIPSAGLEETVAGIWCEVLALEAAGADDNFFDLGGHSLLLGRVRARLEEELGRSLSLVELFRYPTVATLAAFLRDGAEDGAAVAERGRRRASRRRRLGGSGAGGSGAVAVVGLGGRFPGADDPAALWRLLVEGREGIRDLDDEELAAAGVTRRQAAHPAYVRRAGILADFDRFDAGYFQYTPREAELLDPQQRVFLECAVAALENAALDPSRFDGAVGVFAGAGLNGYLLHQLIGEAGKDGAAAYQVMIGNDKDFLATRLSYLLDLAGPSVALQTACSTSLVAIHLACRSLLAGECDAALAGGVSIAVPHHAGYRYENGMILSPDGRCRPFAANAAGTVRSSGAGVVVLRRLEDALADGDPIRAVVRGTAINNDGSRKIGYTAPSVERQAEVIAEAWAAGEVDPATVGYVEAHGTGTDKGDPIELEALEQVFGTALGDRETPCALGSVKSNLGHTDAAAGVTGFIKAVLALEHGVLPPSLHCEEPSEALRLSSFEVPGEARPWAAGEGPRRAGVSSFGIGGTNAHAVLEEAPQRRPSEAELPARPYELLTLSAADPAALDELGEALADHLRSHDGIALADVAYTLQAGRRALPHRRIVVARDAADAASALTPLDASRVLEGQSPGTPPKVAFLFPGQGTQHGAMGRELYESEPTLRREMERGFELLAARCDLDLRGLLLDGLEVERLDETRWTQPALFVLEHALAALWESWGVKPVAMLGHSLGEYVAACRAGVFTFEEGLELVAARGALIQALPGGAMAAVSQAAEETEPSLPAELSLAAVNSPDSCVVSGPAEALAAFTANLGGEGVRCQPLHTSHAFHSAMMEPVLEPFRQVLAGVELKAPTRPFVSNVTGTWITAAEATDPAYWVEHLRRPVRFAAGLATLAESGALVLLEVGPGDSLGNLARRQGEAVKASRAVPSMPHPKRPQPEAEALATAVGRLWLAGIATEAEGHWAGRPHRAVALPTYPFQRRRHWVEAAAVSPRQAAGEGLFVPSWHRSAALPAKEVPEGRWLVSTAGTGFGEELIRWLRERGGEVELMRTADGAFDGAQVLSGGPRQMVFLAVPGAPEATSAFDAWMDLCRALAAGSPPEGTTLTLVTAGAHAVTGGDGPDPDQAAFGGPCRVLPQELPGLTCRWIDLDSQELSVDGLGEELMSAGATVALRAGYRWQPAFEALLSADEVVETLPAGGTYLVLGGFGTVGRSLAGELARRGAGRLVLVGRSSPDAETLAELQAHAVEIVPRQLDANDPAALAGLLRELAPAGSLRGIVHAAGPSGRASVRPLAAESPATWKAALAERRAALKALGEGLRALGDAAGKLDFCLVCTSLSAELGGVGYGAYAASHRWAEAFCERRRQEGSVRWVALAWDHWLAAGEGTPGGDGGAEGGLGRAAAAELFSAALDHLIAGPRLLAVAGDLTARYERWVESPPRPSAAVERHSRPDLLNPYVAPTGAVEEALVAVWGEVLGVDRVGVHDNFFELGGTSLLGVQVISSVNQRFGVEVPAVGLYEGPTVHALARLVEAAENPAPADESPSAGGETMEQSRDRGEMRRRAAARRRTRAFAPVPAGGGRS